MRAVYVVLLLALLFGPNESRQNPVQSTLKLVLMLHRHGDRTPITSYANDPYKNESNWPDGWGQLTKAGKQRMFKVGKFIRQRYYEFLTFNPREVSIRSSAADRCLESVALILAGCYPPKDRWAWSPELNWQPFPIQTEPRRVDGVLNPGSHCPVAEEELNRIRHSSEMAKYLAKYRDLFKYVSMNSGENITTLRQGDNIYDTLFIERNNRLVLPSWVTNQIIDKLSDVSSLTFYMDFSTKLLQRLRAGLFFKDLRMRLKHAINEDTQNELEKDKDKGKKIYFYSSHDSQIASVLNALGSYNMISPPYGSSIIFELHQHNKTDHMLKMFYLNDTEMERVTPLTIPGCDPQPAPCHLGQFFYATEEFIPEDWRKECDLDAERTAVYGPAILSYFMLGSLLAAVVLGFMLLLCIYFKRVYQCVDYSYDEEMPGESSSSPCVEINKRA